MICAPQVRACFRKSVPSDLIGGRLSVLRSEYAQARRGQISMKSVRPDNPDPIPLRSEPPRMGTIMIRFVGLLVAAVVVLALVWSR
jgi:hypothetical protein